MSMHAKLWRFIVPAFYALAMLYITYTGFAAPNRNWDMICYVGSVTAWKEKTPDAIYASAMGTLQKTVPDWMYQQFIQNSLSATPDAYAQQLPFCQVKPLYNVSLWLLNLTTGMPLTIASWVTSALSFAALAFLLFRWRPRYLPRAGWLLLVAGLALLGEEPMSELAQLSTPDALSTVLLVAALLSWVARRSLRGFCLLGLLSMLARPDALIPMGAFTAYFAVLAPKDYRMPFTKAGLYCLTLLLTTTVVKHLAQGPNYTYEHFFIYSFLNKNPNPATMTDHLTWDLYWQIFSAGLGEFLAVNRVIVMIALSAAAAVGYYMKPARGNLMWLQLLLVTWAALSVRFILWPASHEPRFYYGYWLAMLMCCGELISPYLTVLWGMLQEHRRRIQEPDKRAQT